jgi:hypothetical protein
MDGLSEDFRKLGLAEHQKRVTRSSTRSFSLTTETSDNDTVIPIKIPCPRTTIGEILSHCIPPYTGLEHHGSTHDSSTSNVRFAPFAPNHFSPIPEDQRKKILQELRANRTVVEFSPDKEKPNLVKQFENEKTLTEILGKHVNDTHDALYEEYFKGSETHQLRQSSEVRYKYFKRYLRVLR